MPNRERIVFPPQALEGMSQGFDKFAALFAATLGPMRGSVWHAHRGKVELLSTSGVIARRLVEVPDRLQNTGAMLLRHAVWKMHERFGDGGATTAVIARAMLSRASTLVAGGIDPVALKRGMDALLPVALQGLESQRLPPTPDSARQLIASALPFPDISEILAEMVEILGPERGIHLEVMAQPYLDRHYIDGGYWKLQSSLRPIFPAGKAELRLDSPCVLVADDQVLEASDLARMLDGIAHERQRRPVVIVGTKPTEEAQALLNLNVGRGTIAAYFVSPDVVGPERHGVLTDIAILTGAEMISAIRGYAPQAFRPAWAGSARQILLQPDRLIIVDGGGAGDLKDRRRMAVSDQIGAADGGSDTSILRMRLANLSGGVGILQIGGLTENERENKKRQVQRLLRVLPELVQSGSVPGGGIALLACRDAVQAHRWSPDSGDQRLGAEVVHVALEAPFRQLVTNGGVVEPSLAIQRVSGCDYRVAFDATRNSFHSAEELGLTDSLAVLRGALSVATSAVGELIVTGATILPSEKRRAVSTTP